MIKNHMIKNPLSVSEYLAGLPEHQRSGVLLIRDLIQSTFPEIVETMEYSMPTFQLNGKRFCAVAGQKHYVVFYLMPFEVLDKFSEHLSSNDCGKSCIRIKSVDDNDLSTLRRILKLAGDKF